MPDVVTNAGHLFLMRYLSPPAAILRVALRRRVAGVEISPGGWGRIGEERDVSPQFSTTGGSPLFGFARLGARRSFLATSTPATHLEKPKGPARIALRRDLVDSTRYDGQSWSSSNGWPIQSFSQGGKR